MIVTPWTPIETADKAAGAPGTANVGLAIRDNTEHCRHVLYDPDRHAPIDGDAHLHRGDESEHVGSVVPNGPNLLTRAYPSEHLTGDPQWLTHGVTMGTAGFGFSAGGQWASICIADFTRPPASLSMLAGGAHLVVSGYLIADRTLEEGEMQLGLTTGDQKGPDDERSFVEGALLSIPFALITTTWRRFWAVINTEGMEFSASIRFAVQCRQSIMPVGAYVHASLFDVRPGRALDYPVPGYGTSGFRIGSTTYSAGHAEWSGWGHAPTGGPPPPYDHAMAITNAIEIAPA